MNDDRDPRGFYLEFFQGRRPVAEYFPWAHYDLACAYLTRDGISTSLADVGEVLVNFSPDELRAILRGEQETD